MFCISLSSLCSLKSLRSFRTLIIVMGHSQIFTPAQIESFRKGGAILRDCLQMLRPKAVPGISTAELDRMAEEFIRSKGGLPAFKDYHGFPATLCISINEECVHGIPGDRILEDGDIVSLDGGVIYDDLYTDACISVGVGNISDDAKKLLRVTEEALNKALKIVRAGIKVGDISSTIQKSVEAEGCSPVDGLTGHGLGTHLHQFPDIPNSGRAGTGPTLPVNTVVAIEPIIALGGSRIYQGEDGWTISTHDGSLAAHFEHTVLITEAGCEVLA